VRQQERRLRERNAAASAAGSPTPGEDQRHGGSVAAASAAGSPPLDTVQPRDQVGAAASAAGSRTPPGDAVTHELLEQLRGEYDNDVLLYSQTRGTLSQRRRRLDGRRGTSGDRRASTTFMYINPLFFYIADDEAALLGGPTDADNLPISEAEAAAFAEVLADC